MRTLTAWKRRKTRNCLPQSFKKSLKINVAKVSVYFIFFSRKVALKLDILISFILKIYSFFLSLKRVYVNFSSIVLERMFDFNKSAWKKWKQKNPIDFIRLSSVIFVVFRASYKFRFFFFLFPFVVIFKCSYFSWWKRRKSFADV